MYLSFGFISYIGEKTCGLFLSEPVSLTFLPMKWAASAVRWSPSILVA
jgi:hypothetical protein